MFESRSFNDAAPTLVSLIIVGFVLNNRAKRDKETRTKRRGGGTREHSRCCTVYRFGRIETCVL